MSCKPLFNCGSEPKCPDKFGCLDTCPDFVIKRHDTKPPFKAKVDDCDGPFDLTGLVLEASMWAKAKLKSAITETDTYFGFADNIGFEQLMVGDILIMERSRLPEHMLVVAFDEKNSLVQVIRGYHGTPISSWKKGIPFKIMKFMNAPATTEMVLQNIIQIDGTTLKDQLTDSLLVYEWQPRDTCLPGCYFLEFKLLKMIDVSLAATNIIPSFTDPSLTPNDFGCNLGVGVEWVRRFPLSEGFLVQVLESPTMELL